jgi:putative transposase
VIAGAVSTYIAKVQDRRLFPIKALQINSGSKFIAGFEATCQNQGSAVFVLPPRSPKLNERVERTNGTSRREFWELYAGDLELPPLPEALRAWEAHESHERPHRALGY